MHLKLWKRIGQLTQNGISAHSFGPKCEDNVPGGDRRRGLYLYLRHSSPCPRGYDKGI
jgi:hypothetical protein